MIYENIRRFCKEEGITVRKLEISSGLANGTIGKWKKAVPSASSLLAVARVLGKSMEELMA